MTSYDPAVLAFIDNISGAVRRRDAYTLLEVMARVTSQAAYLWGRSIVGFGSYHYKYASGRQGDAPAAAFSPRKAAMSIYLPNGVGAYTAQLERLGEHTTGVGCLYLKNFDAINLTVLEVIISNSYRTVTSGTFRQRAADSGT